MRIVNTNNTINLMKVKQNNLWEKTCKESCSFESLNGKSYQDIAIIGGGYTGCSAALHAAKLGASVGLVDSKIGAGGSSRNVGLVNAGLWLHPDKIEEHLGVRSGAKLNSILAKTPDLVFNLIDEYNINCESIRQGTLHCAQSKYQLQDLQKRHQQLSVRGASLELLSQSETRAATGVDAFCGALLNPNAGTINPLGYCIGLARAAQSHGAKIYQSSMATRITFRNNHWHVQTSHGSIVAKNLIIATNAYQQQIDGMGSSPSFTPMHFFQVATKPLAEKIAKTILPGRQGCWDNATVMTSFRLDNANRLIIGSIGSLDHQASSMHVNWAKQKIRKLFPLIETSIEHLWHGRIAMTNDHLPKIIKLGDNAYSVFGYSGRGIGPATLFGKSIVNSLLDDNEKHLPLSPVPHHQESFCNFKSKTIELGATLAHLV